MIVFSSVSKSYAGRAVLDSITIRIDPGEFVCLTGPSGAGKSTIINLLIRADVPSEGTVEVDGVNLAKLPPSILQLYRRRTGVVFQDYKLLSDRTVYENVAFAMEVCGNSDADIKKRVPALLERIGLPGRGASFPRQLSGGERARVALARALVHQPMVLLADEPTGNIDPKQSLEIVELLKQVHAEGTTILLASHDQVIIDALQTRVIRLENGKIIRDAIGGYNTGVEHVVQPTAVVAKHKIFDRHQKKEGHHTAVQTPASSSAAQPSIESASSTPTQSPAPTLRSDSGQAQTPPPTSIKPEDEGKKGGKIRPIAI